MKHDPCTYRVVPNSRASEMTVVALKEILERAAGLEGLREEWRAQSRLFQAQATRGDIEGAAHSATLMRYLEMVANNLVDALD